MAGGETWRGWIAAGLFALVPLPADALPVLRLFLDGDVERLGGSGGAAVFRDARAEALRLERPALLATQARPELRLSLENEEILRLDAGRYAGTEAHDRKLRLTALLPLQGVFENVPATVFLGVRRDTGRLRIARSGEGTLIDSAESRDSFEAGIATALPWGVSLAGSVGTNGDASGPSWLAEARYRPGKLIEAWYRRRSASWDYELTVPGGVARTVQSPAVRYRIDSVQSETEIGGQLGRRDVAWVTGGVVTEGPNDYWLEGGGQPLPWLTLKLGGDREAFRFDDTMDADGTGTIAAVDLGMRRDRWYGGADAKIDDGTLRARYVHSNLVGASEGEEVGTAAARAFLHVDYDMGLFFRGGYRVEGHQLALGWDHRPEDRVGFAVGAQFFRMILHPADFAITSNTLQRALAAEEMRPAEADLVGLTGALYVPVGRFRLAAAMGQYLPVAARQESVDTPPTQPRPPPHPGPRRPARDEGPYEWLTGTVGKAIDSLGKYGGGNRLLLEISTQL